MCSTQYAHLSPLTHAFLLVASGGVDDEIQQSLLSPRSGPARQTEQCVLRDRANPDAPHRYKTSMHCSPAPHLPSFSGGTARRTSEATLHIHAFHNRLSRCVSLLRCLDASLKRLNPLLVSVLTSGSRQWSLPESTRIPQHCMGRARCLPQEATRLCRTYA